MSVQTVSVDQKNKSTINSTAQLSTWNGRGIVVADKAYLAKQAVEAGVGPGMFDGLGRGVVTIGILFAAAVAALAVGIATGSLQSALITSGAITIGALLVNLFLSATSPRF